MNKNILAIILIVLLVGAAYFYFMSDEAVAPIDTDDTDVSETTSTTEPDNVDYIGLTTTAAQALAQANNEVFRVVEVDDESLPVTEDFRPGRINAIVVDDVVIGYSIEGPNPSTIQPELSNQDVIIGMTVAEAQAYTEANSIPFRVGVIDGEPLLLTMDYVPGRITAEVNEGVIIGYSVE